MSDALDELYSAPIEEFVERRTELASRLRSEGDQAGAKEVAGAKKPTVAAWALNQLRRAAPDELAELEGLQADVAAGGHDLQDLLERRRRVVGALGKAATRVLQAAGRSPSSFDRDIAGTLEAAVVDADALAALTAGRLTRPLSPPGLEAFASTPVADRPARRTRAASPKRDEGRRRKAAERVEAAERELAVAEARLTEAERLRERAAKAVDAARRELSESG